MAPTTPTPTTSPTTAHSPFSVAPTTPPSPTFSTYTHAPAHPIFPGSIPPNSPRTFLLTSGLTPLAIQLSRHLLAHGDNVFIGLPDPTRRDIDGLREWEGLFAELQEEVKETNGWRGRWKVAWGWDGRLMATCQAAVAEAMAVFGKVDVLICCDGESLIGTTEELAATRRTQSLARELFETNFYGPVNCIKAVLPGMRNKGGGHIVVLSSIANHLSNPGLGTTCASGIALDSYCDSLAYEVAPFNIRLSIIQSNMEIAVLSHKITAVPPLDHYSPSSNPAPLARHIIGRLLDRIERRDYTEDPRRMMCKEIEVLYPMLPESMREALLAETIHAVLAIAGHENPPARHVVGYEGVASVKEKLKTVNEELEEIVGVSCAVDIETEDEVEAVNGTNGNEEDVT